MQFSSIIATAILSTAALAAPAKRADAVSAAAQGNAQWTFQSVSRKCNGDNTSCDWSFGINTNDGSAVTPCAWTVKGSPASQTASNGIQCGAFTVSSGWSGQFGADKGFTTIAVTNQKLIAYPSYTDAELSSGNAVSPDRSYPAQNLPQ